MVCSICGKSGHNRNNQKFHPKISSKHHDKEIKTIRKNEKKNEKKNKDDKIKINDIDVFIKKNRSNNDSYNKKRENIIACIINKEIPEEYYKDSIEWYNLKEEINLYIKKLCKKKKYQKY